MSTTLSAAQFQNIIRKHGKVTFENIQQEIGKPLAKGSKVKVKKINKYLELIKQFLRENKIEFVEELKFHPERRWRFDIAITGKKIAVEYEGLMSEKSGHTTVRGYTSNTDKYNAAQQMGWTVLRYTVLNYNDFFKDILKLVN